MDFERRVTTATIEGRKLRRRGAIWRFLISVGELTDFLRHVRWWFVLAGEGIILFYEKLSRLNLKYRNTFPNKLFYLESIVLPYFSFQLQLNMCQTYVTPPLHKPPPLSTTFYHPSSLQNNRQTISTKQSSRHLSASSNDEY